MLRGGGRVEPAMEPHENNKGQLGAIIPPNAPCLPSCLQWLSGEGQIECTHAKGYLGDEELLSGAGWGSGGGGGWAAQHAVFSKGPRSGGGGASPAADSAELGLPVSPWVMHYVTGSVPSGQ